MKKTTKEAVQGVSPEFLHADHDEETELQFLQRMQRAGRVWARRPGTKNGLCSIELAIGILKGHKVFPAWHFRKQFPPQSGTHFALSSRLENN